MPVPMPPGLVEPTHFEIPAKVHQLMRELDFTCKFVVDAEHIRRSGTFNHWLCEDGQGWRMEIYWSNNIKALELEYALIDSKDDSKWDILPITAPLEKIKDLFREMEYPIDAKLRAKRLNALIAD